MSSEDAVVVPFRGSSVGGEGIDVAARLRPHGLTVLRDWPARVAVHVGRSPHPQLVAAVTRAGFVPVVAHPDDDADQLLRAAGPFSFLLLGADVLADDEAVDRVRAWHRLSPAARVKLVCSPDEYDAQVLVRAIRAGVTDVIDPLDGASFEFVIRAALGRAGTTRERVLAIGAHPDDVELGCGGTLLDHRRRGDRISILTLSQGAVGGESAERVGEAGATADAIGAQLIFGDLPDTAIDHGATTIRMIEQVVRTIDPTVVYVHSQHDSHQDHRAVSIAARSATRGVRRVFAYQSPSATNEFVPTQFANIDRVVRQKVDVLQMFVSQRERSYLEPELIMAGARYWARHLAANTRYAEPFEVIRSVGELRQFATEPTADTPSLSIDPDAEEDIGDTGALQ